MSGVWNSERVNMNSQWIDTFFCISEVSCTGSVMLTIRHSLPCGREIAGVIDDGVGAELFDPLCRFRSRCGRDHTQACELLRELNRDRAHAARAADQQHALAAVGAGAGNPEAIEQPFPRGERSERQGRGGGEPERPRFVANDALVHDVEFAVRTRLLDTAGVVDLVAWLEQLRAGADFANDARRIPAEYP